MEYFKKLGVIHNLQEEDINVIRASLKAHLRQCEEMINYLNKEEKITVSNKINTIKNLLKNLK